MVRKKIKKPYAIIAQFCFTTEKGESVIQASYFDKMAIQAEVPDQKFIRSIVLV